MRKYLCVLISIILCLTVFCACSNGKTANVAGSTNITSSTSSEQTTDAEEVTVTANEVQTTQKKDKKTTEKGEKASTAAKSVSKKDNKKTTDASKKSNSKSKSNTKSKSNSKSKSNTEAKKKYAKEKESAADSKGEKPKKALQKENDDKVIQTTSSEINCSITIECKSILDNMDDLKKGHESYVPKNGIMLDNYKATLKSKSTVYDLLKKACNDKGITYTAKDTMYSVYIVGINNIDEKDCGKNSGWMYSVNGSYPNVSVDSKKLKDGDKVVFTYTCSYKK